MKIKFFFIGFITAFSMIAALMYFIYNQENDNLENNQKISYEIVDLNNSNLNLFKSINRKTENEINSPDFLLINFWATWCAPCVKELPSLIEISKKNDFKNVEFILASNENEKKINNFLEKKNINNHKSIFYYYSKNECDETLKSDFLPTTFIVDRNKMIAYKFEGEIDFLSKDFLNSLKIIIKK